MKTERVIFNGRTYTRYPESRHAGLRNYYRSHRSTSVFMFLHVEVWKYHHPGQEIPKGYHIHHVDEDTSNNDPDNLQMLEGGEHLSLHHKGRMTPAKKKHLDSIRSLGWAWHKTKEGREYHCGRQTEWSKRQPTVVLVCETCGESRSVKAIGKYGSKYCSHKCRKESGVDHVIRTCKYCGKEFSTWKFKQTSSCSRSCAMKARTPWPRKKKII